MKYQRCEFKAVKCVKCRECVNPEDNNFGGRCESCYWRYSRPQDGYYVNDGFWVVDERGNVNVFD